jgi:hypothetical protein
VAGAHTISIQPLIDNPDAPPIVPIHHRYRSMQTSPLKFTVSPDKPNNFDITVERP